MKTENILELISLKLQESLILIWDKKIVGRVAGEDLQAMYDICKKYLMQVE